MRCPISTCRTDGRRSAISTRCSESWPLDGNIERLQQISAAITTAAPEFKVRLIDRKPKT